MKYRLIAALVSVAMLISTFGKPIDSSHEEPIYDEQGGQELAQKLCAQMPVESVFYGMLKMRKGRKRSEVPVKYSVEITDRSWKGIYQTQKSGNIEAEQLVVVHQEGKPNEYLWARQDSAETEGKPKVLSGAEAAIPLAGSDYWLSDLGLEFFHWPKQRLIRNAKITMRLTRPCKVLESTNPDPQPGNYASVISWVDAEYGAPIYVEAYDAEGKRMKIFSLKDFHKVGDHYEPKTLEITDEKSDSKTGLELQLETRKQSN